MRRLLRFLKAFVQEYRRAKRKDNFQIKIGLSSENLKKLEQMLKDTGLKTEKDLINNALTLFEWAVRETKEGRTIASVDEPNHSYKEIILPALENVLNLRIAAMIRPEDHANVT